MIIARIRIVNPDNATIALFLYDIVTATDAAGNPTKRSNFEFFFTLVAAL